MYDILPFSFESASRAVTLITGNPGETVDLMYAIYFERKNSGALSFASKTLTITINFAVLKKIFLKICILKIKITLMVYHHLKLQSEDRTACVTRNLTAR